MKDLLDALINHGFLKDDIKFPKSTDDVHIYNLRLPVLPRVVVEPRTTQLVSAAIKVANQFGLKVQARSGGHSYGNYCLGGADGHMVVDMKHFTEFHMDRSSWRATVGSAVKLRDFCQSLHDNGDRAVPHGVCSPVGIGGHATSGGMGQLTRKWGYALDAIVEAEIVTADGEICTANAVENADLFWAVRGAAASFGVVTKLVFETHPTPEEFLEFVFVFEFDAEIFIKWQSFVVRPDLDRNFGCVFAVMNRMLFVVGTYCGSEKDFLTLKFEEVFHGHVMLQRIINFTTWLKYVTDLTGKWEIAPKGIIKLTEGEPVVFDCTSVIVKESDPPSEEAIKKLFNYVAEHDPGTKSWYILFELQNGASNYAAPAAYGHRDTLYVMKCAGVVDPIDDDLKQSDLNEPPISQITKFVNDVSDVMTLSMPHAPYGHYVGYIDLKVDKRRYWGDTYPRLLELKQVWDPKNRFANPQSVGDGLMSGT